MVPVDLSESKRLIDDPHYTRPVKNNKGETVDRKPSELHVIGDGQYCIKIKYGNAFVDIEGKEGVIFPIDASRAVEDQMKEDYDLIIGLVRNGELDDVIEAASEKAKRNLSKN